MPLWRHGVLGLCLALGACATVPEKDQTYLRKPSERQVIAMRIQMARELMQKKSYDQALPYLRDLRAKFPRMAEVRLLLGKVLREKRMFKPARIELNKALEFAPKAAEVHSALGVLLMMEGAEQRTPRKYREAERHHRKAKELAPRDARYHNNLGFCLFTQKKYEDAERAVLEAIRLKPDMKMAFNNLGFIYGMMDREDDAKKAFSQLPRHMALNNMGVVEEMRGRPLSARSYYARALREKRDFKQAEANLQALEPQTIKPKPPAGDAKARD